jgi:hypothetical protein
MKTCGKKFLLCHFFGHVLNRNNLRFIRVWLLSKKYFISSIFCLLDFKITSILEKYFCGFIHARNFTYIFEIRDFLIRTNLFTL